MARNNDLAHSILIVSSSEQFTSCVKKSLVGFINIDVGKSVAHARRAILERDYDLVVINGPLPDEFGEEFALDVSDKTNSSVLLSVPREVYVDVAEHVTDQGIFTLSNPTDKIHVQRAVRFLVACQNRIKKIEKKVAAIENKMEELRIVSRAKILLMEKKNLTEDEAHRYIGKLAMDNGVTKRSIADRIVEIL